jgi:hypothetical protein
MKSLRIIGILRNSNQWPVECKSEELRLETIRSARKHMKEVAEMEC